MGVKTAPAYRRVFVLGTIIYDHKGGVGRGFGMHTPLAFFLGMYMELFFGGSQKRGFVEGIAACCIYYGCESGC